MKKILLATIFFIGSTAGYAQDGLFFVDIFSGASLPKYTFSVGGVDSERDIYPGGIVGSALSFYPERSKIAFHFSTCIIGKGAINNAPAGYSKAKNRITYLQAESSLGLCLGKKERKKSAPTEVLIGLYYGFGLSAKQQLYATDGTRYKNNLSFTYDYKKTDFGFKTGLSIPLGSVLYITAAYEHGLSNIAQQSNTTIKNRCISLTAGLHLGGD
ncbi:hypothetical protein ACQ33O_03075 [Ferruginibacter sp. SUN002]|uniref:hypothetical protein n=1 Tax=Ferruginibacter sp. SUN002 TaxID=2937789 RepID=UPI003D36F0AF